MASLLTLVSGDLLQASEEYLLQQCNCLTVRPHGLSASIASRFPWADVYGSRRPIGKRNIAIEEDRPLPGTIEVRSGPKGTPKVISLFGQHRPGKFGVSYWNSYPESNPPESPSQRLRWFEMGLEEVGKYIESLKRLERVRIALPYQIGCGLAGGKWDDYLGVLEKFAKKYEGVLEVRIYKL